MVERGRNALGGNALLLKPFMNKIHILTGSVAGFSLASCLDVLTLSDLIFINQL